MEPRFEQAADLFCDLAPWEVLDEEEVLAVEGLVPETLRLSVLGGESGDPGLSVAIGPTERARVTFGATTSVHPDDPDTLRLLGRALEVVAGFLQAGWEEREEVRDAPLRLADGWKVRVSWREADPLAGDPGARAVPEGEDRPPGPPPIVLPERPGRNDPCWCGSGRKYKKCHLEEDRAADSAVLRGGAD